MKHSLSASSRIVDFTLFILIVLVSSFSLSYSSTGGNQPWYYMSGGYGIPTTNVWGNNSQDQCTAPASVKGDPAWNLRNIVAGEFHSMALINSTGYGAAFGNVVAWGDNTWGQCLGTDATGTAIVSPTANGTMPVQILGTTLSGINTIRSGYKHNLALAGDTGYGGTLVAWGDNTYDQITIPDDVQFNVSSIAAGGYHSMALVENSVRAWGRNGNSQCSPPLAAYSGVSAIAGGGYHSLALKNNGVLAWGAGKTNTGTNNNFGQSIVPNAAKSGVMAIAGGGFHSVALMYGDGYGVAFGSLVAWGRNNEGQCSIPAAASSGVSAIACGTYNTLALRNGVVIAWGAGTTNSGTNNEFGQSVVPSYLQSVSAIAAGGFHSLAIGLVADTDGDGWNDLVDNCVSFYNPTQADCNNNDVGDACELASGSAHDTDGNGIPDSCEDMDGDGVVDSQDRCPRVAGSSFCGGCPETVCNTPSIRTWITNAFAISDPRGFEGYGQPFSTSVYIDSSAAATAVGNGNVTVTLNSNICSTCSKWFKASLFSINAERILDFSTLPKDGWLNSETKTITVAAFNQLIQSGQFRIAIDGQAQQWDSTVASDVKVSFTYSGMGLPQAGSDTDSDGVPIEQDLCPTIAGPCNGCATNVCGGCGAALDTDGDGTPDCIDDDDDNDGVVDSMDAFPLDASESADTDHDGIGNNVDTDDDGDGFDDATDLCPLDANKSEPGQCGCGVPDTDTDGDGVADCIDNCVLIANPNQADCNGDGVGDMCEIANGTEQDCNANGIPDSCDLQSGILKDLNGNGYPDSCELAGPTGGVTAWGNNQSVQCNVPASANNFSTIATGFYHTIALKDGAVLAWGDNWSGQCDIPAEAQSGVTAIAGGVHYTIALKDGAVLAWGNNNYGQCNIPANAQSGVTAIAGGNYHTIALKDGAVLAWGANWYGQCDIPPNAQSGVTAIAGGYGHTIALKDGAVLAWGDNMPGQCNIPAAAQSGVTAIAGGQYHTIALKDGAVLAWGANWYGQCDIPAEAQSGVTAISCGANHTIALKDGAVLAWGANWNGELNIPAEAQSGVTAIAGASNYTVALKEGKIFGWGQGVPAFPTSSATSDVVSVAGGYSHTIALKIQGSVLAWGNNSSGQCNIPAAAQSGVTAIACGAGHSIALKVGSVLAWGYNGNGQCNIPAAAQSGVSAIAGGYFHTIALKAGSVLAWGNNEYGQCTIPVDALSGVTAIAGGARHTIALKIGAVRAWGYNGDGQCNIPATALSEVSAIAGGYGHTIALKNDGSVIAWGRNYDGECLGTDAFGNPNTASTRGQPVRIMGVTLSGITAIAAGATTDMDGMRGFTMALKSDGSVVAWGSNIRGQCNISETLGFCTAIAAGAEHAIAIQIDCDGNGVADATQTIANPDLDQNHNYQLDSCEIGTGTEEDCNHNGVLDLVEQGLNTPVALASQKLSPIGYGQDASGNTNSKTWTIATPANAISDPVLEIKAFGDFSLTTEYITVFMNNRFIGNYFKYPAKDCSEISQTLTIPLEIFNSIIAGSDGSTADLVIDFMPSIAVDAQACNNGSWIKGSLSYTSAVGADCNANGLLDECETRDYPETDFNDNGIVDECESGGSIGSCPGDLDHNRVLDSGDVSMVLLNIGIITMPGDPLDLDNNGVVDSGDVSWILLNTGDCP